MVIHTCHATGCGKRVPPRQLMCYPHWLVVPSNIQADVWKFYRAGQEIDKRPTPEYLAAAEAAIKFVAEREGKI